MIDEKLINKWLKESLINKSQAKKMLSDVSKGRKEASSNKLIIAASTIGSIALGIGAILFIASNWEKIPNIGKVLILVGNTFVAYYLGYLFKYQKQNLPRVGASLMFLGALLFGATVILVAQIYNLNANTHTLVLIWLIGVLPLVYALQSMPIAGLASLLFFIWITLFFAPQQRSWWFFFDSEWFLLSLPVLYLVSSIMLFSIGGLHYFSEKLKDVARIYRIASLKVFLASLFFLTFNFISQADSYYIQNRQIPNNFVIGFVIFSIIAIILSVVNWFFNRSERTSLIEGPVGIGFVAVALIFFFYPSTTKIYVLLFNLLLAGFILLLLYEGYQREDMKLVNMGMFWLTVFIVVKYFDWFWDLLDRSLFFLVGGLILVLGGIALEKKRRQLKKEFSS